MSSERQTFLDIGPDWLNPGSVRLPSSLAGWLLETGSLTRRLQAHCRELKVELLRETWMDCLAPDERELLGTDRAHLREVLLCCDGMPWVYGRTLIPDQVMSGVAGLAELGTRPLGSLIFNGEHIRRSHLQLADFSRCTELTAALAPGAGAEIWGRRSLLHVDDLPLLVCEVFLPGSAVYKELG